MKTTKDLIIRRALALGAERGLKETTIGALSSSCGVRKSSLYSHFANKEEIQNAVLDFCQKTLQEKIAKVKIQSISLKDCLASWALELCQILCEEESGLCWALLEGEKLRDKRASKISFSLGNMIKARFEVLIDIRLNPKDSRFLGELFYSGLLSLVADFLQRQKEGENPEEFAWETENYAVKFFELVSTSSQETESQQG